MNSTAISIINLSALQHNLAEIRRLMPGKKIMAMVKSNAYGHGLIQVAEAISSVDAFGVATIGEALQLRKHGISCDIVVMRGFTTADELSVFLNDTHLIACIHDTNQIALLKQNTNNKMRIWLKVNTGMNRLGIPAQEFQSIYAHLNQLPTIEKNFVVCSHLADADNADKTFTLQQIACFKKLTQHMNNPKSLLNSAGILAFPEHAFDWIRPGLMLYGVTPFRKHTADTVAEGDDWKSSTEAFYSNFIPVMTLESRLIAINEVKAHEKIGYSCTFTTEKPMKIGIVGMGYGDSYPRQAKNGTPVLIHGERCPIVGRVSMDMITVDVSHLKQVAVNDTVTLWGKDLSVAEIAEYVNTVPHELLCHLTGRVQRVYL